MASKQHGHHMGFGIALLVPMLVASGDTQGRPSSPVYVQSGDIGAHCAIVWARCNRGKQAHLLFDLATADVFADPHARVRTQGVMARAVSDYTGKLAFQGLEPRTTYYYRARCIDDSGGGKAGADESPVATFTTAPAGNDGGAVRFVWLADLAGQGWGQRPSLKITDRDGSIITGGYVAFDVIRKLRPDFALFQGDMIYADNPAPREKPIAPEVGGGKWVNDPAKDFVAISLDDFRANWKYNLLDEKLRGFLLHTPVYVQWDDHEVLNDWYPGETLSRKAPYDGLSADLLAGRARQALLDYNPIAGKRIYRRFEYGRHMDLFLLDGRSYRGPNVENDAPDGIEMLGPEQFAWLKAELKRSTATWKVIATTDPLSIVTGKARDRDGWSQGDPRVLGREVQLAELLTFVRNEGIENIVFLTADVHFAAAIRYEPERATYKEFEPFWEFVVGPVHAGAFGPDELDESFGPRYDYLRAPGTEGFKTQNLPPPNLQSFGEVAIGKDGDLTVRIHDITGTVLYERTLKPRSPRL